MGRTPHWNEEALLERAMHCFWWRGYHDASMADLVDATGVNRQGIYSRFGDKHGLFLATLACYRERVVTPAFARVEAPGAGLEAVAAYLEHQIALAASVGLPGPGCLIANTQAELAAHDAEARRHVEAHDARLRQGFAGTLRTSGASEAVAAQRAAVLAVAVQGLWSHSRSVSDPGPLRRIAAALVSITGTGLT